MDLKPADYYFASRLHTDAWDNASYMDKEKALRMAYQDLEPYRPRLDNQRFFCAVCEQALWYLQGDQRAELQQAGVGSFNLGSLSETFQLAGRPADIAPKAWALLRGPVVKGGSLK
ncbi:hypothetical protein GJ688_02010 [Heliobacillus mobilis]|uniref:Uncharacterized protein n=1 Tax=Heliobacterium mobile TaxID=28064 RepID=A0A6I3SBF1_HELMO|nr:hypothetical protein [Heliobacterium mobile]MTV47757.1 hypothetical protein [Heliobacterium mobile]